MPKVSIIVTTYNVESYIKASLESVLGQTLRDIEVIIVDDGSTDGTRDVIRDTVGDDPRVKLEFFEENTIGGVASAANAGMELATGDFIGFADGDDLYDPTMFEKLYDAAIKHDADMSICRYYILDDATGKESEPAEEAHWEPFQGVEALQMDGTERRKVLRLISVPWRKIYRKDLVAKGPLRYPVGDYFYEDNPFHWGSVIGSDKVAFVHEKLCWHRVARAGQTMSTADERLLRIFYHHDNIRDQLHQLDAYDSYRLDLLRWAVGQLSWVSRRTEGELRKTLFDRLTPIATQYSDRDVAACEELYGFGREMRMMRAVKNGNYDAFLKAGWSNGKAKPKKPLLAPLWGTLIFLRNWVFGLFSKDEKAVRNEDLLAAMVLLQDQIKRLDAKIEELKASDDNR